MLFQVAKVLIIRYDSIRMIPLSFKTSFEDLFNYGILVTDSQGRTLRNKTVLLTFTRHQGFRP